MSKVQSIPTPQPRRSGRRARIAETEGTAPPRKKRGDKSLEPVRGVQSLDAAREWLISRGTEDIECVVPDQAGVGRGKMMPVEKFLAGPTMSLPSSILTQTITGDYPDDDESFQHDPADRDILFEPDL